MAIPVAVTDGAQDFVYADLPKAVTMDGGGSFDPDGDPITAYSWVAIGIPDGSAAVLDDAASATPSFTADLPGTYLWQLTVTAGGDDSDNDLFTAPASSFATITVTTEHRALGLPADGEREYGAKVRGAIEALDALAGDYDAHAADGAIHWGKATAAAYGVSKLTAAPAAAGVPISVGANDANWKTLTDGSNADALHTHAPPTGNGRHHDLRPDLLVGPDDLTWTGGQIAALTRTHNINGDRQAFASADVDSLLQIDIEKAATQKLAGVLWSSPAGDFQAIIDLRLSFDGPFLAQDLTQSLAAGFGWMPGNDLAAPDRLIGAGVALSEWGFRACDLGATDALDAGATTDWNADAAPMTALVRTGLLVTEFCVRLRRSGTDAWAEVSVGGGGYVRVATWSGVGVGAGYFALFGALKRADAGLRIKSTGFRLTTPDLWFGV